MNQFTLKEHSLMFAPMEGVTDEYYRNVIHELYPEWDTYSCDFLRVPGVNPYPTKHIEKHIGRSILANEKLIDKTVYQILTSPGAYTKETVEAIAQIGMKWLDLNLGCPSKTVCKNKGGSFLLSEPEELRKIIKLIRTHFPGIFTCKIRVGYRDDSQFENILKMLEDEGVDAIKIHARTRDELYKGVANWDYVKRAVKTVKTPIIGNGDIWTVDDIKRYFDYTECHSIMLARPALKTPWIARLYANDEVDTPQLRIEEIIRYYKRFYQEILKQQNLIESSRIKRLKSISRYLYDDLPQGDIFKRRFLLSKSFNEQLDILDELKNSIF
ncbi:MAG: tRNA-dihydrouridine synthase [Bacteriovoracaceae bacterium]|jgi:tRNA-dihydrouridine synthase B